MATKNKRYYWLQLKKDFFYSKEMKLLRKIPGGDTYTVIYLKMMLASLEDEGKIFIDGVLDNPYEEIALEIDEDKDAVEITINFLLSKDLITISQTDVLMEQVPELVGSETASTRRSRKHREQKALQCNTNATNSNGEIEIEKDIEIDAANKNSVTQEEFLEPIDQQQQHSIFDEIQENFGRGLRPVEYETVKFMLDENPKELVSLALKRAILNGKPSINYMDGILRSWRQKNITTVLEAEQELNQTKSKQPTNQTTSSVPEWSAPDFKEETTEEEQEHFEDIKRQMLEKLRNK